MDWIVLIGTICLGGVLGTLVGWYVCEAKVMAYKVLTSAVGIMLGAGALGIMKFFATHAELGREAWGYPIGLAVGLTIGYFTAYPSEGK